MRRRFLSIALGALIASPVLADEPPTAGLVQSAQENHSLTYRCSRKASETLSCEFVQTSVRRKRTVAEVDKLVEAARTEFWKSGSVFDARNCKGFQEALEMLEGKRPPPNAAEFAAITAMQRADTLATVKAGLQACKSKNEADTVAAARLIYGKDLRTCAVSSQTFSQTFKRTAGGGKSAAWVAQGSPEGVCGTVQVSRFEFEAPSSANGVGFWNYIARRVISNPKAVAFPGPTPVMCSAFEQPETPYSWRQRELQLGCDYIEFSVL